MDKRTPAVIVVMALLASPALASVIAPPARAAQSCTLNGVDCAIATAQSYTDAQLAAATPPDCTTPLADKIVGSAGTGQRCMRRLDEARQAVVQPVDTTTDPTCKWSVQYPRATVAMPSYVAAEPQVAASTQPDVVKCNVVASLVTTTSAGGYCSGSSATTLGSTLTAVIGSVVRPFQCTAAAQNVAVKVLIRDPAG